MKEFHIKDREGRLVITVKLIDERTWIFVGTNNEEFLECSFVPLIIPIDDVSNPEYQDIESINDLIDRLDLDSEGRRGLETIPPDKLVRPELVFFVHCSNLEAWVLHNFNTRILDYRLAFPILKELSDQGHMRALQRFKEEILERFYYGSPNIRQFLWLMEYTDYLDPEELYSILSEEKKVAILGIRELITKDGDSDYLADFIYAEDYVYKFFYYGDPYLTESEFKKLQELLCKFPELKKLASRLSMKEIRQGITREIISDLGIYLKDLKDLKIGSNLCFSEGFDFPHPFPSLLKYEGPIFSDIGKIPSLEEIIIKYSSDLTNPMSLPESIKNLKKLKKLKIENVQITRLPESFGCLESLEELVLKTLPLKALPGSFGNLKKLRDLEITKCDLGVIPDSFGNLSNLEVCV